MTIYANCHPERKHSSKGLCRLCYQASYRQNNGDRIRRGHKIWRDKNPDKVKATAFRYRSKQTSQFKVKHIASRCKKFGITLEQYFQVLDLQNNQCAICLRSFLNTRPNLDHSHQLRAARGILCMKCNIGLGYIETANFIERCKRYLCNTPVDQLLHRSVEVC